jgi:calcineurin-like phosphoesterase family protein
MPAHEGGGAVAEWWQTFFDEDYFRIWGQLSSEENNAKQAAELWSMLDLSPCG